MPCSGHDPPDHPLVPRWCRALCDPEPASGDRAGLWLGAVDDPAVVCRIGATLGAATSIPIDVGTRAHRRAGSLPWEDLVAAGHWLDEIRGHVPQDLLKEYEQLNRDVARTRDCEDAPLGLSTPTATSPM